VWNRKNRFGWTPLLIAQGYRFGNFKPSPDTVAAIAHDRGRRAYNRRTAANRRSELQL
jgi:hypothetical protein